VVATHNTTITMSRQWLVKVYLSSKEVQKAKLIIGYKDRRFIYGFSSVCQSTVLCASMCFLRVWISAKREQYHMHHVTQ
jgi:hypothetical protein